jgi:AbiV family abortive infection protein
MAQQKNRVLSFAQVKEGYIKTLENAIRLFGAAQDLLQSFPDKALALAQLGQEEVGRSLTLLAAFSLPPQEEAWQWVWSGWSDHVFKAHRAYLYEIISPLRVELRAPDGRRFAGEPLLERISQEKEVGFYVDFDDPTGHFFSPEQQVSMVEATARTMTLMYLSMTADAVRRALLADDEEFRFRAFSELAFRMCSEDIYQQDMPRLLAEFRKRSARHEALVMDLETALAGNVKFLSQTMGTPAAQRGAGVAGEK